ncbi:tetratricopeptide repeat protein [candidate division WOR-3 bacterium]|jgi:tetratricopeptide (TPR) repeat protein|nr:tetratricopeptide repeat protein [candidate division WOR-3 bacterium]
MQYIFIILALTVQEKLDKADYMYENRHEEESYLDESKLLLEEVLKEEPGNEETLRQLARLYYTLGDKTTDKNERLTLYEKGQEIAEKLIKINDNNPEGHFWLSVNIGRVGQVRGVMKSLSLVPAIRKEFEKALELKSEHTGAMDGLAVLYYELPRLFGGNLDKSLEYLNKAVAIDSNYSILYIDFANVYIKKKEYDKAESYLNKMLEIKNPTHPADFYLKDKVEAEKLLEEIKKHR